jgi:hypothetical protein
MSEMSTPEEKATGKRWAIVVRLPALLLLISLLAPFVDARVVPFVKWPQFFGYAFLAWAFARLFLTVWENRRDDRSRRCLHPREVCDPGRRERQRS